MPARLIHRFGNADRSFRGAELSSIADIESGDAVLFGLAGHRSQSQAIRDASWYAPAMQAAARRRDLGDAESECGLVCAAVRRRAGRPFLIGGTMADAVALARPSEAAALVLFSARLDLPAAHFETRDLIAIGCHDLLPASSVRTWRAAGGVIAPAVAEEPLDARLQSSLPRHGGKPRAVIVVDAGVVDTGHAAGARSINVGGLTPLELLSAMSLIVRRFEVEGLAVINLDPHRDPRGHTELVAAEAVDLAFLGIAGRVPA
ncbi:MAG: hypothetical protein KJS95_09190 [Gammaproteobacteria bacterium]|nr:hypothetical protein [Gammaproteobacteria bacterium]